MQTLIADIEADGLLDTITKLHQISIIDADTGELESYNGNTLMAGVQRLAHAECIVGHHFIGYDIPAVEAVYGVSINPHRVIDTMILSKLGNPTREGGHSLEAWGERMGVPKVEHEDWTTWTPAMEERCNQDTRITLALYERLKPMYDVMPDAIETEHKVAIAVRDCVARGFKLDIDHCHKLVSTFMSALEKKREEFKTIFPPILVSPKPNDPVKTLKVVNKRHPCYGILEPGAEYCPLVVEEFNPASRQQIAKRLITKYGWTPTVYTKTGIPEVSEDTLRDLDYPEAQAFADYLTIDKKLGQVNALPKPNGYGGGWLHYVKENGRVHASLNSNRANTHRMACSSPNLQQVSTDKDMRRAWVPGDGMVLVGADAEGLELRCLAHYLAAYDGGSYADILVKGRKEDGTDVHSVARDIICFYDRDETKRGEYGWLYGAGDAKLGIICAQDAYKAGKPINYSGLGIDYEPGGRRKAPSNSVVGKAVRNRLEEGFEGLGALVQAVQTNARARGKLKGLDGRTLWVRSAHSALNLLLQSAGAIIIKRAWREFDPSIRVVMQVHDEWQIECKPDEADDIGKHVNDCVQKAGEALGFRCPLASAYQVGTSWAETH